MNGTAIMFKPFKTFFPKHIPCNLLYTTCSNNSVNVAQIPFRVKSKKIKQAQQAVLENINSSNQYEMLSDSVTPHWKISYEEELEIKQNLCTNIVNEVLDKITLKNNHHNKKSIVVNNIVASPVRDAYRNKDEFSVWPGLDGNPKTVGFFIGSPAMGKVVCVPATHLKCIKESHKEIAQLYQDLIRSSALPVSYQIFDGGFWRNIKVRSNDAGDHQITVITHPGQFPQELIAEQQQVIKEYFNQHVPSLSVFHQSCRHVKCTSEQAPIQQLCGESYLTETLSGLQFRISSDSFFQLNRAAAELMFQIVINLAKPKHYSTLLDLYCGTGTVSLLASELVRGCVGIEESKSAVKDANENAALNNITNCSFVTGKVELKLANVLKQLDLATDIVAVLNPGRNGAVEGVISLLRQNQHVRRVVYISCKPDNPLTMKNFVQLCERVSHTVQPFTLTKVVPVDLFPYTSHCELILCFERRY